MRSRRSAVAVLAGMMLCPARGLDGTALPAGARPGYLIVTPQHLIDVPVFDDFVAFKRGLGFNVHGVAVETIDATMPGRDLPEKVREYLKRVYGQGTSLPISNVRYVLLVGGHGVIPFRGVWGRWASVADPSGISYTDCYYADLTGDWDSNGNDMFGQGLLLDEPTDDADLHYEVAVGRLPFTTQADVEMALDTIIAAESDGGAWKQRTLGMGAFMQLAQQAWVSNADPPHYRSKGVDTDNAVLIESIWQETLEPLGMTLTRAYEITPNPNGEPPSAYAADYDLSSGVAAWTAPGGYGLVNLAGHGNAGGVYRLFWAEDLNYNDLPDDPTEPIDTGDGQVVSRDEITGERSFMSRLRVRELQLDTGVAPVVAVAGCKTAHYNDPNNLGAEFLALGRASAYVGSLQSTGYSTNWTANTGTAVLQDVLLRFSRVLLDECPRVGDATYTTRMQLFDEAVGEPRGRGLLRDVLYGDPAMSYWGNAADFEGPWPMFRHDIRNTGSTTHAGPANGWVRWTFPMAPVPSGKPIPSPIVGPDGTIYVGSDSGRLYAVHPDGEEKWHYDAGGAIGCGPILTVGGTLYFRAEDGYLYALNTGGELLWSVPMAPGGGWPEPTPLHPPFSNSPRVRPDGTVYALAAHAQGDGQAKSVHAYRPTGQPWVLLQVADYAAAGTPAVAPDGMLYVLDWGGILRAYSPDLMELGSFSSDEGAALGSPAVGSDGLVYFGDTEGQFYAVRPDMTWLWRVSLPYADNQINSSPAIGEDGSTYFGSRNHRVYALKPYASLRWQFDTGGPVDSSPALDPTTAYIVGGMDGDAKVFALDRATGAECWNVPIGGNSTWGSSPAIGLDNVIYVVSSIGQLIAIGEAGWQAAPSGIRGEGYSPDQLLISWRNNNAGTAFGLERRTGLSPTFVPIDIGTNLTSYLDGGLQPNTRYAYRVRALTPYPSGYSEEARIRTPRPVPGQPPNPSTAAVSAYGIRLTWSGLDPNALAVAIYRAPTATGPYTEIGLALAGVNAYDDLNPDAQMDPRPVGGDPSPGRTYFYRLRAFNDTGESPATAPVPGATRGLGLPAPTALTAERISSSRIRLTWQNHATGNVDCIVERACEETLGFDVVATLPPGTTQFEDVVDSEPGWCIYRIHAASPTQDSPFAVADAVYVTGSPVPTHLISAGPLSDGSFGFGFVTEPGVAYEIKASVDMSNWMILDTFVSTGSVYNFVDGNAAAMGARFYRVLAGP